MNPEMVYSMICLTILLLIANIFPTFFTWKVISFSPDIDPVGLTIPEFSSSCSLLPKDTLIIGKHIAWMFNLWYDAKLQSLPPLPDYLKNHYYLNLVFA